MNEMIKILLHTVINNTRSGDRNRSYVYFRNFLKPLPLGHSIAGSMYFPHVKLVFCI